MYYDYGSSRNFKKKGLEKIGDLINFSIDKYGLGDISQSLVIFGRFKFHLAEIMGESALKNIKCQKFEKNILFVKGKNGAWSNELQVLKYDILDKIHKDFGKDKVKGIKITTN